MVEFVSECNADKVFLLQIGVLLKQINKADNNDKVAKAMHKQLDNYHKTIIGLTDKDKTNLPRYFHEFNLVDSNKSTFFHHKPGTHQYIVFLKPAIEGWLLAEAKEANINPEDFGLPVEVKKLKLITANESIKNNQQFKNFIAEILKSKTTGVLFLQKHLQNHVDFLKIDD